MAHLGFENWWKWKNCSNLKNKRLKNKNYCVVWILAVCVLLFVVGVCVCVWCGFFVGGVLLF